MNNPNGVHRSVRMCVFACVRKYVRCSVCVCGGVCVYRFKSQVGIVSYGENVTHRVNLSQFDNRESLLRKVMALPQDTGIKTMTASGIETARYRTRTRHL